MCGIAGFISPRLPDGSAPMLRSSMLASIRHRGPDEQGTWEDQKAGVWLGMQRLSIIALVDGTQPIWSEDGQTGVFFNGEIYNYRELRSELERGGHRFTTASDTEVLVHGFEQEKTDFLRRVRGMFAVCWVDRRQRRLVLARDHFGQKPLYWFQNKGTFAFASEIKALRKLPDFPQEIRQEALLDYLTWFSLPAPETHYTKVWKLPPAHTMEVPWNPTDVPPSPKAFWETPVAGTPFSGSLDDAAEELDHHLQDSMSLHLRADVPLGLLLSGGLDSKTIGYYAKAAIGTAPRTYTAVFDGEGSEQKGARETATWIDSHHTEVTIRAEDLAGEIGSVAYHLDEPMGDPAALALGIVCRRAREDVKVALSGEGSDELLAGYAGRYLGELANLEKSARWRKKLGWLGQRRPSRWPATRWQRMRWRMGAGFAGELPALAVPGWPGLPTRGFTEPQCLRYLRRAGEIGERVVPKEGRLLPRALAMDQRWQLPEYLLQKADKMSMSASLELRAPFLDPKLAEFAATLPDNYCLLHPHGPGKRLLRHLLDSKTDARTMNLPKEGFTMPFAVWMRGPLRANVEGAIFASQAAWRDVLEERLVRQAWNEFLAGQGGNYHVFYALWLYEVWHASL